MNRPLTRAAFIGLALAAALAGCDTPGRGRCFPTSASPTAEAALTSPRSTSRTSSPDLPAANVEHSSGAAAARRRELGADRLQAAGGTRRLRVRITDASVKETELPRTRADGAFTSPAQRYDMRIEIFVELTTSAASPSARCR